MIVMGIDNQYLNDYPFNDKAFSKWNQITDLDRADNYLWFNDHSELCVHVHGKQIPMFYYGMCSSTWSTRMRDGPITVEHFKDIMIFVKTNL